MIKIRRIYETPSKDDGLRILVDRLWPRGGSKEKASVKVWLKDIAPSHELRHWFGHDPQKWNEFKDKYIKELKSNKTAVGQLKRHIHGHQIVTLLYAAKDPAHNNALVLQKFLTK